MTTAQYVERFNFSVELLKDLKEWLEEGMIEGLQWDKETIKVFMSAR